MSRRRQIIDHLGARLQQIAPGKIWTLPDGDYTCTSAVADARPWRKAPNPAGSTPAICWRDRTERIDEQPSGPRERWLLTLHLAGYLAGSAPAAAARELLADMVAATGADPRCGGLAHYTHPTAWRLLQRPAGEITAAVLLELAIIYTPVLATGEAETFRLLDELDNYLIDEAGNYLNW